MKLYLVRHTRVALPAGICYGWSDVPLADPADMVIPVSALKTMKEAVVYTSPLQRCRILAERLSENIRVDERLKELDFGMWEGVAWDDIKGPEAERWMADFVHVKCPGGESYLDLQKRVKSFLSDLKAASHHAAIIVTHGGVIRTILAFAQNIPLEKSFEISVGYGEIREVDTRDFLLQ